MTLYSRREKFSSLSSATGKLFGKLPLSPNQWTIIGIIPALIGLFAVYKGYITAAIVLFALTAFLDIVDGAVARYTKSASNYGAFLDTVTDRCVEFVIILSFMLLSLPDFIVPARFWIFLLLFGSVMSSFVKSASVEKGVFKATDGHGAKGGILEHSDRMIFYIVAFIFYVFSPADAVYLIALLSILSVLSALQRFFRIKKK